MKTLETIIDKKDLFDFLDGFTFTEENEIEMAVCDYIEKQEGTLYYSDCALAGELAEEYKKRIQKTS